MSFLNYLSEREKFTKEIAEISDAYDLQDYLERNNYKVKKGNSKTINISVNTNRFAEFKKLGMLLQPLGAKYDATLAGSSIGGLITDKGLKIYLKPVGGPRGSSDEAEMVEILDAQIKAAVVENGGNGIKIKYKHRVVSNVFGCALTSGVPKSDFHLVDDKGKEISWISYKKGSTPRDFNGWGGMSTKNVIKHQEVKQFIQDVADKYPVEAPPKTSTKRAIKDKDLAGKAIYGDDYKGANGKDNVDIVLQGLVELVPLGGDQYEITSSSHVLFNGEIPTDGYEPVLSVRYGGDRSDFGIKNARFSLYQKDGRTWKEEI